jgi:hypothetical protein
VPVAGTVNFTGEMIYPWMFDTDSSLTPFRDAAHMLAAYDGWPNLYDLDRLEANDVPVVAAVYPDDMYVDCALSLRTADRIRSTQVWLTGAYEHDGLRQGTAVIDRLLGMLGEAGSRP